MGVSLACQGSSQWIELSAVFMRTRQDLVLSS